MGFYAAPPFIIIVKLLFAGFLGEGLFKYNAFVSVTLLPMDSQNYMSGRVLYLTVAFLTHYTVIAVLLVWKYF